MPRIILGFVLFEYILFSPSTLRIAFRDSGTDGKKAGIRAGIGEERGHKGQGVFQGSPARWMKGLGMVPKSPDPG